VWAEALSPIDLILLARLLMGRVAEAQKEKGEVSGGQG
jgi:hypothetical protein